MAGNRRVDNEKFALLMVDPDADVGNSRASAYLHWLLVNCGGFDATTCDTVYAYQGPAHAPQTRRSRRRSKAAYPARRRFVFVLMKQSAELSVLRGNGERMSWSLHAFIDQDSFRTGQASFTAAGIRPRQPESAEPNTLKPTAAGFIFVWHNETADGKEEL